MKTLLIIAAACTLGLLTSLVVGQDRQPLPPGVAAADWIAISDKVGFVVTQQAANRDSTVLAGYFLAWHENSWKRIDSQGGFRFQPAQK